VTAPAADDSLRGRCLANLQAVRSRIASACGQAGRRPEDVRLVAVTKYVDATVARLVAESGCGDLAESRPQRLRDMAAALADVSPPVRWHLVGHLQRNKVRMTLPSVALVQTLDSERLLAALDAEVAAAGLTCDVLVEVNLTADPGRSGVTESAAPRLVAAVAAASHVRLRGLMGMAARPDSPSADARRDFARLRLLRDALAGVAPAEGLRELSMGMSGDFEAAILEGSTMVRIGSALFEGLV
jgi:pyridoxal phosphate enzyme (YggS family)